jgi:hypothetical protein
LSISIAGVSSPKYVGWIINTFIFLTLHEREHDKLLLDKISCIDSKDLLSKSSRLRLLELPSFEILKKELKLLRYISSVF